MNKKLWIILGAVLVLALLACSATALIGGISMGLIRTYNSPISIAPIAISANHVTGSGNVISETRNVSGFDAVVLEGSGDVNVAFGSEESVVVESDDNIVPLIETTVQNGKLVIGIKGNTSITTQKGIHVNITMKSMQGVSLKGSGNIKVSSLVGKNVSVDLSGSGTITMEGTADSVDISLPGSGNIYCDGLKARSATVSLNGSGNISVYASDSLDATLRGSGNIRYSGNPAQVNKSVTGSGTVTH